jgi:hypothetical protein
MYVLSKPTILAELSSAETSVAHFFGGLAGDELVLRVGSAWTPMEHLAHLNTAVRALAQGFGVSRWLLRFRFGKSRRPSRPFEMLRDDYLGRLGQGAGASGAFVPEREEVPAAQRSARQRALLMRWQRANAQLRAAVDGWTEADLDRLLLPHPILGKITAREMLFFAIYHGHHHVAAAKRRLPRFADAAGSA